MAIIVRSVAPSQIDAPDSWDVGPFTEAEIADAVDRVKSLAGDPDDDNLIPTFWPRPNNMPKISQVDFGDVNQQTVKLKKLLSSNRTIKRDRLLWHIEHPGERLHANPFTSMPLIGDIDEGTVIIDGHHSLGALLLLGAKKAPVWGLPMNPDPDASAQ